MTLLECIAALVMVTATICLLGLAFVLAPTIWMHTLAIAKASSQLAYTLAVPFMQLVAPSAVLTIFVFAARTKPSPGSNP